MSKKVLKRPVYGKIKHICLIEDRLNIYITEIFPVVATANYTSQKVLIDEVCLDLQC